MTENLCIPQTETEESNKSAEPLHKAVWGSAASQQEKLLLNASIKMPARNVSSTETMAGCAKTNGTVYEVALQGEPKEFNIW